MGGRTRPLRVASDGGLIAVCVPDADSQDPDGGGDALHSAQAEHPALAVVWAGSRSGESFGAWAAGVLQRTVDVRRTATDQAGFGVQASRWVVERTFAWFLKCRRVVREYGALAETTDGR